MTREDYIAALLLLLRLFENTLAHDHVTRDGNYIHLVQTLEMFLPCEVTDGDIAPIKTVSKAYLDRIQKLFLYHNWTRQHELCREWTFAILALTQGV